MTHLYCIYKYYRERHIETHMYKFKLILSICLISDSFYEHNKY